MLTRIRRLWSIVYYVIRAKKAWSWPRKSDVLIFDGTNQAVLMEYLHRWSPEVLHVRGEQINIRVLLSCIFRTGNRREAYVDCFIETVHPKLIVTFIDNDVSFFTVSQRHPEIKTIMIQNGWRSYHTDVFETLDNLSSHRQSNLKVDYLLLFGSIVGSEYAKHISGSVIPVGSIKNNRILVTSSVRSDIIAFVSQWRPTAHGLGKQPKVEVSSRYLSGRYVSYEAVHLQSDRVVIPFLAQYSARKHKRLMIIPRRLKDTGERDAEEAYFHDLLGHEGEFLEPEGLYPCYRAVDAADIVVAVNTTVGYEAIARGTRTAMFSIRSSLLGIRGFTYGWPGDFADEGPFWTNRVDAQSFERILDYLGEIDDAQWQKDVETSGFSGLMMYDPGNSILRALLETELGPKFLPQH